jgi:CubicO group peptidase (beta-lactamase class C family)
MRYLKPTFPFRAGYGYSNLMFVAAGEVVASVSGQAWEQFIRDNILDPLQMRRTVLTVRNLDAKGNAAQPHATIKGKMESLSWVNWDAMGPAGGIISCVADMARWLQLQLGRGTLEGRKIFAARLSQDMWTPHNTQRAPLPAEGRADRHFRAYGLGWSLSDYKGRLVVEHGGSYDGMTSQTWMMPEEQLGMVVLTNSDRGISGSITSYIRDAFLGEPEKDWGTENLSGYKKRQAEAQARREKEAASRVTGTRPSLPLEGYAGTYGGPMYGNATVTLENGGLVLRLLPNPDLVADLTHWHYDTFELTWRKKFAYFGKGKVLFVFNNLGKVIEMKLDVPNEDFWFDELELLKQK